MAPFSQWEAGFHCDTTHKSNMSGGWTEWLTSSSFVKGVGVGVGVGAGCALFYCAPGSKAKEKVSCSHGHATYRPTDVASHFPLPSSEVVVIAAASKDCGGAPLPAFSEALGDTA